MRNAELFWAQTNTSHPCRAGRVVWPKSSWNMDEPNQGEHTLHNQFFHDSKNLLGHIRESIAKGRIGTTHTFTRAHTARSPEPSRGSPYALLRSSPPPRSNSVERLARARALAPPSAFVPSNAVALWTGARGGACHGFALPLISRARFPARCSTSCRKLQGTRFLERPRRDREQCLCL